MKRNMQRIFFEIILPSNAKNERRAEEVFAEALENLAQMAEYVPFTLELVGKKMVTRFIVSAPAEHEALFTNVLFTSFKEAEITQVQDPLHDTLASQCVAGCSLTTRREDAYPLRTFDLFDGDTLTGLLNFIGESNDQDDEVWLQLALMPLPRQWTMRQWLVNRVRKVRRYGYKLINLFHFFSASPEDRLKAIDQKLASRQFRANILIASVAADTTRAKQRLGGLISIFRLYRSPVNELKAHRFGRDKAFVQRYQSRHPRTYFQLSLPEVATLFHLPDAKMTGHTQYVRSKKAEPPANLALASTSNEIHPFAETNYRNKRHAFGFLTEDRRRHMYIVGKSGSGKSKLMELLIKGDIEQGHGVCVLDPHGELVEDVLRQIPKERAKDVIIFDPSDYDYPIAFNPLHQTDKAYKMQMTIGLVDIFKKLFSANWNPRLEHLLRNIILALLDSPNTTLLSIEKMLSDKNYRRKIVDNIQDPNIKQFWMNEFAGYNENYMKDAINPLINKIGQLSSNMAVRNILGQPDMRFDIRDIIDNQKILLIKLPKGLIGEEVTSLLGAIMVTKLYQAAMQRADMNATERKDFFFYIDEFQNFSTDTFSNILAEARKYRLNLTIAHQYLGQLSDLIRKTVFGNVGSIVIFRTGAEDAKTLALELAPRFDDHDIMNLSTRDFYLKMSIQGEMQDAFSARTLESHPNDVHYAAWIQQYARQRYGRPVAHVNKLLENWATSGEFDVQESTLNPKEFKEPLC